MLTLSLTYPAWSRALLFVANMLAPAEVQFGMPWLPAMKGLPLREAYVSAKQALNLRMAWESYRKSGKSLANIRNGLSFQEWCSRVLNLEENRRAYLNGQPTDGRPLGSVVPDFTANAGSALVNVFESKSASASLAQAHGFADIARAQGSSVNYIFLVKPDQSTVSDLKQAGSGVDLTIYWLFSNVSEAPK